MLSVPEAKAGQSETCPKCNNVCQIPAMPYQPPPLPANVATSKGTSGLGIAALVLGIIACLTAWIPLLGIVAVPIAVIGLVLGALGLVFSLVGRRSQIGMPVSGIIVCGVAIGIQIAWGAAILPFARQFTVRTEPARIAHAVTQIDNFKAALNMFEVDCGRYPTTEEGLQALIEQPPGVEGWKQPYIEGKVPSDPWGNPYLYRCPGLHNHEEFDLFSYGPDGKPGTADDIDNWSQK